MAVENYDTASNLYPVFQKFTKKNYLTAMCKNVFIGLVI